MKTKKFTKQKFLQIEWISKGRETMNKLKSGISLVLILIASAGLHAQFAGWPASSLADEVDFSGTTTINTEVFLDDDRARVTAATLHSNNPLQYDLTISPPTGVALTSLNFPANKWCLLIQMEDHTTTNVGNNSRVNVVSYNSGTGVLRVEVEAPNVWPTLSLGANDRVQIIRVPVFWDLNLDPEGIMTCTPYNHSDGTGGIVPFIVGNNLELNGGIISAAGKGYHYGWATTPQLGQGGAGNSAPAYTGLGGGTPGGPHAGPVEAFYYLPNNGIPLPAGTQPPINLNDNHLHGYLCSNHGAKNAGDFNSTDLPLGGFISNGDDGDVADNNSLTPGTSTAFGSLIHYNPSSPTKSAPWGTLRMGNSGNPGADGGEGGGGGGHGGRGGGNSFNPMGGQFGLSGWGGQSGGDVGEGGRGGGIVLIKVNTYNINVASGDKIIFVDGQNGQHGRPGGKGGKGGAGGLGENGGCAAGIVPPGGVGGFGESGIGARGGDGGNGGDCGTIWIMKKSSGLGFFSSHVSLKGGRRGGAGMGGYSTKWLTLPLANNYSNGGTIGDISVLPCNPKNWHFCPPPEPVYTIEICDCDKVFDQILNLSGATGLDVHWNNRIISDPGDPLKFPVYYNDNHNGQEVLFYVNTTFTPNLRYNCHMYFGNIYNDMVRKMFKQSDLILYNGASKDVGINSAFLANTVGPDIILSYFDGTKHWPVFKYKPGGTSLPILTDIDHPGKPEVWSGNCYYNYTDPDGTGGTGGPPEPGKPIPPIEYEEITGPSGVDGDDGDDGDYPDGFYEDDMAILIRPHDNGAETLNDPGLVTVLTKISSTGDINQVYIVLNDKEIGKVNYKVQTVTGATIETGSFENFVSLSHLASGIYLVRIESGTKQEVKKVVIP